MADFTSRSDAQTLINEADQGEIWQAVPEFSAALRTFRRVNMGTKISRYPVIAALPNAGFVSGEDPDDAYSVKPTTSMRWTDRVLTAEEIAGIALIPENVIDDAASDFDLWAEVRPRIAEAIGITLDGAVFFGTDAPASWPDGLVPAAITAGNEYVEGTSGVDLAEDINQTFALVEDDGYDPDRAFARRRIRARLRGLRATSDGSDNTPIFTTSLSAGGLLVPQVLGTPIEYVTNGAWDDSISTMLVGDPNFAILGIRQDITYKFLDQAAVTVGGQLISLAERDILGLRFKMRVGFQTAETLTVEGGETAYPFATLTPAAS
jgi:HK97 family phage major capsid protein